MPQDRPTAPELLAAVRELLERELLPESEGARSFHVRVAANVLAIVERELIRAPALDEAERQRLVDLLGHDGSLEALNRELCARIRAGAIDAADPALRAHLCATTAAKLEVANPKYR